MPLTGVGKIFKPSLRYDAAVKVFTSELAPLCQNGTDIAVTVDNHPVHGTVATVTVRGGERETLAPLIAEKLGPYTLRHEVVWPG